MKLRFFELAKRASVHSSHYQHKLGCVIVKNNKVISIGFNKLQTHPRSSHPYKSLHAEVSAIIKANRHDLIGAHAYVYRETKNGTLGLAKPCDSCFMTLKEAGITKIFFTSEYGYKELE